MIEMNKSRKAREFSADNERQSTLWRFKKICQLSFMYRARAFHLKTRVKTSPFVLNEMKLTSRKARFFYFKLMKSKMSFRVDLILSGVRGRSRPAVTSLRLFCLQGQFKLHCIIAQLRVLKPYYIDCSVY